jgi:hypothetical protein
MMCCGMTPTSLAGYPFSFKTIRCVLLRSVGWTFCIKNMDIYSQYVFYIYIYTIPSIYIYCIYIYIYTISEAGHFNQSVVTAKSLGVETSKSHKCLDRNYDPKVEIVENGAQSECFF